jgi:transcriptional antiterminator Rof (Rho-off)
MSLHIKLTAQTHLADGEILQGGVAETTSKKKNNKVKVKVKFTPEQSRRPRGGVQV